MTIFDNELWKKTHKIYNAFYMLYGCCGTPLCKKEIEMVLSKDVQKIVSSSYIKELESTYVETIKFIIYETLRLSQTKKK